MKNAKKTKNRYDAKKSKNATFTFKNNAFFGFLKNGVFLKNEV